ncbi:hypothetical protein NM688_g6697 [Phlebia brevispora]|uniref:Uncharacterized protein n=1 Tax=Phlebia brevispora TaxID=194682 RepID=A0ACC1SDE8_9APHY|nr:hypothetical protein NM688_g6697 [Phlebia brevispora]
MRLLYLLACLHGTLAALIPAEGRDLTDVFGGLDSSSTQGTELPAEHPVEHVTTNAAHATSGVSPTGSITLDGLLFPGIEQITKTSSKASTTHSQTSPSPSPTSNSVIGTPPPLPSYTPYSSKSPSPSATSTSAYPTPTNRSQVAESASRGTLSWKIVGVAVISFTAVAAVLLLSVFFDQWWGFMRDLFWKKKDKDRFEEFIPDWEQASWEIKMDKDASDRYPSFAGPPKRTRVKDAWHEKYEWNTEPNVAGIGSGGSSSSPQNTTPPERPPHPSWSLGFVTPVPPPPALHTDFRARERSSFERRKSRVASTAYSDVDPYAGIE